MRHHTLCSQQNLHVESLVWPRRPEKIAWVQDSNPPAMLDMMKTAARRI